MADSASICLSCLSGFGELRFVPAHRRGSPCELDRFPAYLRPSDSTPKSKKVGRAPPAGAPPDPLLPLSQIVSLLIHLSSPGLPRRP